MLLIAKIQVWQELRRGQGKRCRIQRVNQAMLPRFRASL